MCGRYIIFTSEEYREMKAILREISKHYKTGIGTFTAGEIFPSTDVPAVVGTAGSSGYGMLKWGMELYNSKKLIINARGETLGEKRMFSPLLESGRCLLPANGFFEWKEKEKYFIKPADLQTFYMAGLYNRDGRMVIITTSANSEMEQIHDRMPVIFNKETGRMWLDKYDSGLLVPYGNPLEIKKAG
jgi:putative SOS response-associated peptidase YedK